jgi:hypothetical protein
MAAKDIPIGIEKEEKVDCGYTGTDSYSIICK